MFLLEQFSSKKLNHYFIKSILTFAFKKEQLLQHTLSNRNCKIICKKTSSCVNLFFFKALLNSRSLKVFISNALLLLLQFLQANKRRRPHCVWSNIARVVVCYCNGNHSCTWKHRGASMIMASYVLFSQRVGVIMHVALYYQAEIITHSSVLASCIIIVQL